MDRCRCDVQGIGGRLFGKRHTAHQCFRQFGHLDSLFQERDARQGRQSIRRGDSAWRAQLQQAYDELSAFEQPVRPELRPLMSRRGGR